MKLRAMKTFVSISQPCLGFVWAAQLKNPANKVVQSLFVRLECFTHAATVNQLAYCVGMQSRLTTWAVSSRDAEQQRLPREDERRQLRECQAAATAAVSLPCRGFANVPLVAWPTRSLAWCKVSLAMSVG